MPSVSLSYSGKDVPDIVSYTPLDAAMCLNSCSTSSTRPAERMPMSCFCTARFVPAAPGSYRRLSCRSDSNPFRRHSWRSLRPYTSYGRRKAFWSSTLKASTSPALCATQARCLSLRVLLDLVAHASQGRPEDHFTAMKLGSPEIHSRCFVSAPLNIGGPPRPRRSGRRPVQGCGCCSACCDST